MITVPIVVFAVIFSSFFSLFILVTCAEATHLSPRHWFAWPILVAIPLLIALVLRIIEEMPLTALMGIPFFFSIAAAGLGAALGRHTASLRVLRLCGAFIFLLLLNAFLLMGWGLGFKEVSITPAAVNTALFAATLSNAFGVLFCAIAGRLFPRFWLSLGIAYVFIPLWVSFLGILQPDPFVVFVWMYAAVALCIGLLSTYVGAHQTAPNAAKLLATVWLALVVSVTFVVTNAVYTGDFAETFTSSSFLFSTGAAMLLAFLVSSLASRSWPHGWRLWSGLFAFPPTLFFVALAIADLPDSVRPSFFVGTTAVLTIASALLGGYRGKTQAQD